MCRGDRKEPIFKDDFDRNVFLQTLEQLCQRTGFIIHAYVLMPNHYHFLLETPEPNLVDGMKWFQGTYTQRFNLRHELVGHLFQGRYKAIPVDEKDPSYFRTVGEYILLNPISSDLLHSVDNKLEAYPWSSYPMFVHANKLPEWLQRKRLFSAFGIPDESRRSRKRFSTLITDKVTVLLDKESSSMIQEEWIPLRRGWFIGSEEFRDELMECAQQVVGGHYRSSYRNSGLRKHDEKEAARLLETACKALDVSLVTLWKLRQANPTKQAVAWHIKSNCVIDDAWICQKLEMGSRSNIQRAVRRFRDADDATTTLLKRKLTICAD